MNDDDLYTRSQARFVKKNLRKNNNSVYLKSVGIGCVFIAGFVTFGFIHTENEVSKNIIPTTATLNVHKAGGGPTDPDPSSKTETVKPDPEPEEDTRGGCGCKKIDPLPVTPSPAPVYTVPQPTQPVSPQQVQPYPPMTPYSVQPPVQPPAPSQPSGSSQQGGVGLTAVPPVVGNTTGIGK